ncbi:unnamed protein product [Mytilus edulis]|uniref:Uncharacterized protein n=1 Tax=Mytilus edulis TaxID=6550 RepID=A0A8S3QV52_MYTED|nr:unnamed protein product [Mytilus edulis]
MHNAQSVAIACQSFVNAEDRLESYSGQVHPVNAEDRLEFYSGLESTVGQLHPVNAEDGLESYSGQVHPVNAEDRLESYSVQVHPVNAEDRLESYSGQVHPVNAEDIYIVLLVFIATVAGIFSIAACRQQRIHRHRRLRLSSLSPMTMRLKYSSSSVNGGKQPLLGGTDTEEEF